MKQNIKIPEGYKNSPLGIIPEEWEVKKIKQIADYYSGGTPDIKNENYYIGDIPFIRSGEIHKESTVLFLSKEGLNKSSSKLVKIGDLLYSLYGANSGDCSISKIKGAINQAILCINSECVINVFLQSYLELFKNKYISKYLQGGQGNLSGRIVGNYLIHIPPLPEQQKIAEILSTWDEAIEKQTQLINLLEKRKHGLMQQLLTGKKRLKGFTDKWEKYTYNELLKEVKRKLIWNENELYKLISVKRRSEGLFQRESLYGRDIKTKKLRPAKTGDFLISKMQIVHGAAGLTTSKFDNMKISNSYIALVAKDINMLDIKYFNLWSKTPKFYHQTFISSYGVHIEKMTFNFKFLLSLSLKIPNIDEQRAIVNIITNAYNEINLAKQKLESFRQQKKGLMQVLLTGKKRIKLEKNEN